MPNAFSGQIGVTAEERVINAFSLGSDISTRNIGLLVERVRGVDNKPTLVTSLKEDKRIFGDHNSNMYSSYVVENLFKNTGGYPANVFQVRIVGTGSIAAKAIVANASADTQTLVSTTTQNASATQGQINEIEASNVEVGDEFSVQIEGTDDLGGTPTAFDHTATFTATTTNVADVIAGLEADLTTFFGTLTDTYTAAIVSGKLVITSPNNAPFTITASTTNDGTSENIFEVVAGREGEEDKGDWGNEIRVRVFPIGHTNGSPDGYKMDVFYQGYLVETYISDATDWESLINQVNQLSEYVLINAIDLAKSLTLNPVDVTLSGGVYVAPTESQLEPNYNSVTSAPEGMAIFEGVDVQILACPEVFTANFQRLCENFARDVMKFYLFNLPYLATESVIETYYNTLFTPDQSFAASVLNWCEVPADQEGNKIWIPSIGYALGAGYIRKAGLYNGYVWTPPAGVETNSKGIFRFTHDNLSDETIGRYVKKWRTNVVKFVKNVGFCLWSSRTYSNNSLFESIHIRLETNWIVANVKTRNERFIQRLNTPTIQKEMKVDNLIWFKNLYEQGGIEASIPFDEAVIIEVETSKEDRKEAEMEIAWIPPECLEHIHIKVSRNDGVLIFNV